MQPAWFWVTCWIWLPVYVNSQQTPDTTVMKTLNLHGDRISDLEILVKRLMADNQVIQKRVNDLEKENAALKNNIQTIQGQYQNCCPKTSSSNRTDQTTRTTRPNSTSAVSPTPTTKTKTTPTTTVMIPPSTTSVNPLRSATTTKTTTSTTMNFDPLRSTDFKTQPTTTSATTTYSTKTPTTLSSTATQTSTSNPNLHLNPTTCMTCLSDAWDFCDILYQETTCYPPNNYCINHVTNQADGTKLINRTCGNFDQCHKDWFQKSSDKDVCQTFDENQYITLGFECVYCCEKDLCNELMKPPTDTLYYEKPNTQIPAIIG